MMSDFLVPVVVIIGVSVVGISGALGLAVGMAYLEGSHTCPARWAGTYETDFSLFGGCRVKVDGKWWPESRYRYVEITK